MQNSDKNTQLPISDNDNIGKISSRNLELEMRESYLAYAMSVIVARALPDVRDGLKPVHRRILFSMHELGLRYNVKHRKSATVVGDVLGKYHPHGDVAVYDTMVRMAQHFSMRYPLVDGQGNFGSMDGDSAAAMRYTEAKMKRISEEMLADIEKDTVDFVDNYDGTRKEPQVLPARVPQLLLNGTLGIAVGMATNIPPHNIGELLDGVSALIDNSDLTTEDLMKYIKGPDFPTGGIVFGEEAVRAAYGTGKGKIIIRGVAEIEEMKGGKFRIIISEIPYQVNKAELIAKIAELAKLKKIEGITDLRDESDRKFGVRIVIELKSNAYPKKVLNKLYQLTNLQTSFHFNMLALVDGIQPKTLTLKDILVEFIKHRKIVVRRRTEFELKKAKERAHILEGLKKALDHIDEIIATIKKSETKEIAHNALMTQFDLSDLQSSAILEMKLSTLAGLERKKIEDELLEKLALIKKLEEILGSESKILEIIKQELAETKEKYADERRTKITSGSITQFSTEDLVPNEQVIVTITKDNYIKRVPIGIYRAQKRGGKGKTGLTTKETDSVEQIIVTMTHNKMLFFTDKGRVFSAMVYDIPSSSRQAKGQALVNFLQLAPDEKVTTTLCTDSGLSDFKYFFMTTTKGNVKKTEIAKFDNVRRSGLIGIKLNDGDKLRWVFPTSGEDEISIITKNGQSIHFTESDVRPMGRGASGVRGIKLRSDDEVIASNVIKNSDADIITVSSLGYGKRTNIKEFTLQKRGGVGLRAARVTTKTGKIVATDVVCDLGDDIVIMSEKGIVLRTQLRTIKILSRDTQGVRIIKVGSDDKVASMSVFKRQKEEEKPADPTDTPKNLQIDIPSDKLSKNKSEDNTKIDEKKLNTDKTDLVTKHTKTYKVENDNNSQKPFKDPKEFIVKKDETPNYWGNK